MRSKNSRVVADRLKAELRAKHLPSSLLIFVAVRKFLVPFPGAFDDGFERLELRAPAKFFFNLFRRSDEPRRVARSTRFLCGLNFSSGNSAASVDDFSNAGTAACAEVVTSAPGCAEGQNVRLGEVKDVNVVADTCPVRRIVISSINFDSSVLHRAPPATQWE